MSHHFLVPVNENGLFEDQNVSGDVTLAMAPMFQFNDVFVFSHGWWTDATRAMEGYNRFTIEFSSTFRAITALAALPTLSIGVHWPSTLSEDQFSLANYFQALSFYTMEKRADTVGENSVYALLKLLLSAHQAGGPPFRVHLVGHSFGCKVVCKALQQLVSDGGNALDSTVVRFDMVLLQAAFDNDELETANDYGAIVGSFPSLRLLVTRSDADRALGTMYPKAHQLAHIFRSVKPALGASGPSDGMVGLFGGATQLTVSPDMSIPATAAVGGRLVVADLTPLHQAHPENNDSFSGHHSDIFHGEIYRLLSAFFFNT
jgi:Alpha/beta hydrolase of unknown function (DUF900)